MKLFTDEEMLEKCAEYLPIPLALEQKILHYDGNPEHINILNGVIKSPYKTGQPVTSVTDYAYQLPFNAPVDPEKFLEEYNKVVQQRLKEKNLKIISELSSNLASQSISDVMGEFDKIDESLDQVSQVEYAESARAASTAALPDRLEEDELKSEQDLSGMRTRRTKRQMIEARQMGEEDKYPGGKV